MPCSNLKLDSAALVSSQILRFFLPLLPSSFALLGCALELGLPLRLQSFTWFTLCISCLPPPLFSELRQQHQNWFHSLHRFYNPLFLRFLHDYFASRWKESPLIPRRVSHEKLKVLSLFSSALFKKGKRQHLQQPTLHPSSAPHGRDSKYHAHHSPHSFKL